MPRSTAPRLFVDLVDGATVVTFADARILSEDVIEDINEQLDPIGDRGEPKVVLNFREVQFMSSALLATLLKFARRVATAGGELRLCGLSSEIRPVFKVTRFDQLFRIYPDEAAALDSF